MFRALLSISGTSGAAPTRRQNERYFSVLSLVFQKTELTFGMARACLCIPRLVREPMTYLDNS
jgi:hypothetical protein